MLSPKPILLLKYTKTNIAGGKRICSQIENRPFLNPMALRTYEWRPNITMCLHNFYVLSRISTIRAQFSTPIPFGFGMSVFRLFCGAAAIYFDFDNPTELSELRPSGSERIHIRLLWICNSISCGENDSANEEKKYGNCHFDWSPPYFHFQLSEYHMRAVSFI